MTTLELITAIGGGPVITAAGVGVWKLAKMLIDARARDKERDDEREERTEHRLWTRVDHLDRRLDECEERHRIAERRGEECERRAQELEGHVRALQEVALRNDNTGRHLLAQRTSPPPAPLDLPPLRRRKEE